MSTFYINSKQIKNNRIIISGEDFNHIKNVQRHKIGDKLEICDEAANRYQTVIKQFLDGRMLLDICDKISDSNEAKIDITLFQGLPKYDKMDFIVQKAVEIGAKSIVPVIMERTIVKVDDASGRKKVDRWQKIAEEAAKQSYRQLIPNVENIVKLENIIENLSKYDIVIVPYECEKDALIKNVLKDIQEVKSIAVVIGPEGGFSENDIRILEKLTNMSKVSLGKRILRTETASIATMSMLIYEYDF